VSVAEDADKYVPVESSGASGAATPSISFMIHALLSSRIHSGLGDDSPPEDDVNIYLTHLLCDYVHPETKRRGRQYLSTYDTSVFERVRSSTNTRFKYTVYRANADHLLMMMGVFHNPTGARPKALAAPLQVRGETHVGRGKAYYDYAFTYSRSLYGRSSGITDVLGKLAAGFERYLRLLSYLRAEYLHLVDQLSPGDLFHLERGVLALDLARQRDVFLDAWSDWKRAPTPEHQTELRQAATDLERLDPNFHFEVPAAPSPGDLEPPERQPPEGQQ